MEIYISMGVRGVGQKNTRKLMRLGNKSLVVSLPVELLKDLGWRDKQKVVVKRHRGGLIIKDWKK